MIPHPITPRNNRFGLRSLSPLGGDRLAAILGRRLDDGYHYFHKVTPAGTTEIETIVVGPGGTWTVLRAGLQRPLPEAQRALVSLESVRPIRGSRGTPRPVNEARLAGHRLELYLERATQPSAVEAVPGPRLRHWRSAGSGTRRPGILVEGDLERLAARIIRDEVLTPAQVDRIVALLDPRQPLPRLATSSPQG